MNIKKQPLTKSTNTSMGSSSTLDEHPCYDSYDSYDNFDSLDDFDLNAWGKGARLHYRTERRSGVKDPEVVYIRQSN